MFFHAKGYDYKMILTLLVEAAIHWMEVGLLLQILKIVIYQKDMKQTKDDPMLKVFSALKQKWLKEQAGRKKKAQVGCCEARNDQLNGTVDT